MSNKTKEATTTPKTNINYKKLIKRLIAKPVAYITLFVLAAYGMREVLKTINNTASTILTVLSVLALVYILFIED